ncbi:tRNA pseudouridine(13) synthase TruD [Candidatus Woesearchaeota archaeon]|nr:tRNA pseudouridine(13) synthase TruD [Candidatus Woesearchaeota archaeon]
MYKLKQIPEDFIVEENIRLDLTDKGDYSYFSIEKKNWNTKDIVKIIAKRLNIRERRINIAGIKDKIAITKQYISVFGINPQNLARIKIKDVKIEFIGYGNERIKLGQTNGNKFVIVVRNLDSKGKEIKFIENYFDDQRFGGRNHLLGEALVKKEFRKFCYMLRLKWEENDYIGAIRKLKKGLLTFYINSYQSLLWNKAVSFYVNEEYIGCFYVDYSAGRFVFCSGKVDNIKVPVLGFGTEFKDKKISKIYNEILKEEKIKLEDFIFKEIPELVSEGVDRDLIVPIKDLKVKYLDDERNKGKKKAVLRFSLPPGSYGTIVVKKMFN